MRREKIIVKLIVLLTLLQCIIAKPKAAEEHDNGEERSADGDYRLPTAITPENYNLEITTNLNDKEGDGFTFSGIVEIVVSFLWKIYFFLDLIFFSCFNYSTIFLAIKC